MNHEYYKIILKWKDVTIEVPITQEQQEKIIRKTMLLVYGRALEDGNSLLESLDYLIKEEQHLRTLLLQLHQNRRIIEQQKASIGDSDVPLRIVNALTDVMKQIKETTVKINEVSNKIRRLKS
jgi:hypothetical protein